MLTVLGVILVLFSCISLAMQRLAKERKKNDLARDFRQLFSYLAEKIEYTQDTLPSLLQQASNEDFGEVKDFLAILTENLSDGNKQTLREAWQKSLQVYADKLSLTSHMRRILKNIGDCLGQLALRAEIENLNKACADLDDEIRRGEKEFAGNAKLIKSSGILLGILLVILFL